MTTSGLLPLIARDETVERDVELDAGEFESTIL